MSNCPTQEKDFLQCSKMNLRSASSTKCCGDWHSFPHSHNYTELFYVVGGNGQFQANDRHFPIQAHQLIVVKSNVVHTVACSAGCSLEYIIL